MDNTLSFLLEHSTDFYCVLDKQGVIIRTNPSFRKTLGYSEAELNGKFISVISHPADIRRMEELLKILFAKKEMCGFEIRLKAIDGRYYNVKWSLVYNAEKEMIFASGCKMISKINGNNDLHLADSLQHIIQSFSEGFVIIDSDWKITSFNPAFQSITGLKTKQLTNTNFTRLRSLALTEDVLNEINNAFNNNTSGQIQYYNKHAKRWLRFNIFPYKNEVMIFIRDITLIKNQQLILSLEKDVLQMNASCRNSLPATINKLLKGIEDIYPEMICSVLEVDDAQEKVKHLAGPRLPNAFCEAIDDMAVGPKTGSCGTAVFHRTQIIVINIETDPLWENYRYLTQPHGFRACWSTPIISSYSSKVLATFAIYYTTPREPKEEELQLIERTAGILRVLIENKKNLEHVQNQNERLQEIASISSHDIRRPVATILGLVSLFDSTNLENAINPEIINHLDVTAKELDAVIHTIVEKTIYLNNEM